MEREEIIGIIGAMDVEIEGFASAMTDAARSDSFGSEAITGTRGAQRLVVVKSGIGKVNAGFAAQMLVTRFGATRIYMTGIAGALGKSLVALDLFVPDKFVQYDVIMPGESDGYMDILGGNFVLPDKSMADALANKTGAIRGTMATGERFVEAEEDKADILRRFPSVMAADMESGAVAQVCARMRIPMACVKVISDAGDSMEYGRFKLLAAEKSVRAVLSAL